MKKIRKIVSIVLSVLIIASVIVVVPTLAKAVESTGNSTFDSFINDSRWRNGAYWDDNTTPKISSWTCWGCCAYCADFVKYCYNNNNPNSGTSFFNINDIYAGDIIILGNGGDGTGHWFVVLKRNGNKLYTAERYGNSVRIGWNYTISGNKFSQDSRSFTQGHHFGSPQSSFDPVGQVESVRVKYANTITIKGWAYDRDNDGSSVYIDIYAFKNRVARITANKQRDDIAAKNGVGKYHGFEETITMPKTGTYNIAIYAINIEGGKDTEIYYNSVTVKDVVYSPEGELESVVSNSDNTLTLKGWAFDRENTSSSIYIDVYAFRNRVARITANKQRDDIGKKYNVGNYHGFEETIKMPQAGEYNIAVYAINIGDGEDTLIYNNKVFVRDYSKQTISDGDYHIASALDLACSINVAGGNSKESGMNVHLWKNEGPIVTVKYLGDGYYSLVFKHSGMAMDVYNAGSADGTNVLQYKQTTNDNQKWIIKEAGDNYTFNIISKCNGLYLDVAGGSSADGTNIQMYHGNGTASQKWRFYREPSYTGKSVEEGKYRITSKLSDSLSLDIADKSGANMSNVQVFNREVEDMDTFEVEYLDKGLYTITPTNMNRRLDIVNNVPYNKADVQIYDKNTSASQKWILQPAGDGYYSIIAYGSGLYLDVSGGGKADGTNVQVYLGNDTDSQKWKLSLVKNEEETSPATDPTTPSNVNPTVDVTEPATDNTTSETLTTVYVAPDTSETTAGATNPENTEPNNTLPVVTESSDTAPIITDPITTEPVFTTPVNTDPIATTPIVTEPSDTTPTITNPITTEPVFTTPVNTDPITTTPDVTEPFVTNPVAIEPTMSPIINPSTTTPKVTTKKANPIKVTVKTKTIKAKKLKKKAQKVKAVTVKNAQGKVSYKLVKSGITKKIRKLVKINSKGVITFKKWKKAKKGTYKIKVTVKAAGNANYKAKTVTKTVKVKVK